MKTLEREWKYLLFLICVEVEPNVYLLKSFEGKVKISPTEAALVLNAAWLYKCDWSYIF